MSKRAGNRKLGVRLRVNLDAQVALGPGKADLLEAVAATGSISAAGRRLGIGYKRAWELLEAANAGFADPLLEASTGGPRGGGATLTPLGRDVLRRFRRMERAAARVCAADLAALRRRLRRPA